MPKRLAACFREATFAVLVIIVLLTGSRAAQAAAPSKHEHGPGFRTVVGDREQVGAAAPVPPPAATMAAYQQVDEWVRAWRVSDAAGAAPVGDAAAAPFAGVHIQIRLDGQWIGRGQAFAPESDARANSAAMLALAAREAMAQAESRLVLPNDATRDAAIVAYARRMLISLELAGPMMIFEPRTWEEAEIMLAPGLDGVAVRIRPKDGAAGALEAAFPTFMMATAALPHRTLGGLCAKVIGEGGAAAALEPPANIRTRHALRMYRFRTTHLAQCAPGAAPVFLHRGERLIAQSEITAAELHRMAAAMAEHLARRADSPNVGLGWGYSYDPVDPARHIQGKASIESTALALLALQRYGDLGPALISETSKTRLHAAWASTAEVVCRHSYRYQGDSETALFLVAAASQPESVLQMPFDPADCMAASLCEPVKSLFFREWPDGEMFGGVPQSAHGACALAYALFPQSRPLGQDGPRRSLQDVEQQVRTWIGTIPQGHMVSHMPWLGWAEIELARHKQQLDGKPADIPSAIALREMRRQVWEHMISAADAEETPDFAGGIVFTKGRSPLPTWQSARPLAFIATMLRDDRLTDPHERMTELVKLLEAIRFIRQLQADDSIGWMALDPAAAVGGVRAAPWDFTLPPDATSLSLLLLTEAIRSLDALTKPAESPAPPR
ncbi:MAG: hypothetical protein KF869_07710 [Phycisphaeraceae bacterium]|nr:hypothetical protein [Phycisphaeraceae bacterium]